MVSKRWLTPPNSASCVYIAYGQKQEDAEENGCNNGPFDRICGVAVPPAMVVVVMIVLVMIVNCIVV